MFQTGYVKKKAIGRGNMQKKTYTRRREKKRKKRASSQKNAIMK